MATFIFSDNSKIRELYVWLQKRPWTENKVQAAYMTGYIAGVHREIMTVWESNLWSRRKAGTWITYWFRERITRDITELFFRNGEGFVDRIVVQTPEVLWYYNWKGDVVYVDPDRFNKKKGR